MMFSLVLSCLLHIYCTPRGYGVQSPGGRVYTGEHLSIFMYHPPVPLKK